MYSDLLIVQTARWPLLLNCNLVLILNAVKLRWKKKLIEIQFSGELEQLYGDRRIKITHVFGCYYILGQTDEFQYVYTIKCMPIPM